MKYYTLSITIIVVCILYTMSSCTDKLPEPAAASACDTVAVSYNAHVKAIMDSKCASTNCHDGSQSPNLTSYNNMSSSDRDRVYERAVAAQTMPPSSATPLTSGEIDSINCWKEGGFLEN